MKAVSFSSLGKAGTIQNKEVIFSFMSQRQVPVLSPSGQNSLQSKVFLWKEKKFLNSLPPFPQ